MTTGVLFDLDLTLVEYDPAVPEIFEQGCRRVGVEPTDERFAYFDERHEHHFRALAGDPFRLAARDLVGAFDLAVDPETLAETLLALEREAAWVHDEVRRTVERLAADRPIGVVTQGYGPVQREKLRAVDLAASVETVVTPDDVGVFKPDPDLFVAGAKRLLDGDERTARHGTSTRPGDVVVVGDDPEDDVVPANEAGFRSVLYRGDDDRADVCLAGPGEFERLLEIA